MWDWSKIRDVIVDHAVIGGKNLREKSTAMSEAKKPLEELVSEQRQVQDVISHLLPAMHYTADRYANMVYNPQDPRFLDPQKPKAFMTQAAIKEWYRAFEGMQVAQETSELYQPWKKSLLDDMEQFESKYILSGIPEPEGEQDIFRVILDRRSEFIDDMKGQIRQAKRIFDHYQARIDKVAPEYQKARGDLAKQAGISLAASVSLAYVGGVVGHKLGLIGGKVGRAAQVAFHAAKNSHMG